MHIAVVGLGFGEAFAKIYRVHTLVSRLTVCDIDGSLACQVADQLSAQESTFEAILEDPSVEAVHLLTPLPLHAEQTLRVLRAGKHCACAVTMASTLDDIRAIVSATRQSRKNYMMMETMVYGREFLLAKGMRERGEFGKIAFLRGDYYQDLEATYPDYWRYTPPMHYATHCVGPILAMAQTRATSVSCVGCGRIRPDICDDPKNPFPMEVAHFKLEGVDAIAQVNRAWYQAARQYVEAFSVFGEQKSFEWQQLEDELPVVHHLAPVEMKERWRPGFGQRVEAPARPDLLPAELEPFCHEGHGGSHPHLVHEFLTSINEGRKAAIDEITAANWCAAGICAHESALRGGEWVEVPRFDR